MYVPGPFAPADPTLAWRVARAHPFGVLYRPERAELAPLPWLVDEAGGRLRGHLARANTALENLDGASVQVSFQGPDAYVSPRWYAEPHVQVPTWNYVFAVATGRARTLDREETRQVLWDLCARFEPEDGYRPDQIASDFLDALLGAIVGVEVAVEDFQAKLKLSQNRSAEDHDRVKNQLEQSENPNDRAVAAWMKGR